MLLVIRTEKVLVCIYVNKDPMFDENGGVLKIPHVGLWKSIVKIQ